jgi:hypothetical protein
MIDNEETAIPAAGAGDPGHQGPLLRAKVNMIGILIDMGSADTTDTLQYCMCWQLTRVLGPSLSEIIPPALERSLIERKRTPLATTAEFISA